MPFPWRSFRDWLKEEEKLGEVVRFKMPIKAGDPKSIVDAVPESLRKENMAVLGQPGSLGKQMETELRAVTSYLHTLPNNPIGVIDNPVDNTPGIPIVVNPWATQERSLRMWGCQTKEELCTKFKDLSKNLIKPTVVKKKAAPCKEVIVREKDVDFYKQTPRCWVEYETIPWSPCGGGQLVIFDPETKTHDLNETRGAFFEWEEGDPARPFNAEKRKRDIMLTLAVGNVTRSDAGRFYMKKYRKFNKPMPAVYTMCNDPGFFAAANARTSLEWPENGIDDYWAAGGFNGVPVEVVESETIPGLMVPANAEFVIEGEVLPEDYVVPANAEGLYLGYMEGLNTCVVFRAKCITYRRNPMWCVTWSDSGIGGHTGVHMGAFSLIAEVEAINYLRGCGYDVNDVVGSYDLNMIVVQTKADGLQKMPRYGSTLLHALYGCTNGYIGPMNKYYISVGPDIDPYDLRDVVFALNTRCQPITDVVMIPRGGGMDPSCARGPRGRPMFGEQMLMDALIKVPERLPNHPQRTNPKPQELEAIERIRKKIASAAKKAK